ncbi:MAG TPA: hypothetical protein VN894_07140 [Polyangiaceae bacterium]|nr:hypothetical protein [Polyangiaceae bacterium]
MRALALLGVLTTAACGLDMGGLAADSVPDTTQDATSTDEAATPSQDDGSAKPDTIVTLSADDAGPAAPEAALLESSVDATSTPPVDSGDAALPSAGDSSNAEDGPVAAMPIPGDAGYDAPPGDTGSDAAPDAPSANDGSTTCTHAIPAGWRLALYTVGPDACPSNFTAHDVYAEATVGPTACSCACSVTQDGDCMQGSMTVSGDPEDNGPTCPTPLFSMDVSGAACLTVPPNAPTLSLPTRTQASPLPAQGGACSGTAQVDPTQVSTAAARYCDVPASSADSVCSGALPSGFAICIATNGGMAACPLGSPFVHSFVVEDSVMLQCTACTACTVATTCSNATISAYDNRACRNAPFASLPVDGACDLSGAGNFPTDVLGVKYSATAATTCTAGTSTAAAQLSNPRTICCQ